MSASQADFVQSIISRVGYNSKKDLIEKLFIQSLNDSYNRINHEVGHENQIRDRFIKDLYQTDSEIKKWLQLKYIDLIWENWVFTPDFELARTDVAFKLTGLHFVLECKRLKNADKAYVDEGLERFVNLKYGTGDAYAGMIGFVVAGDKDSISKGLQSKIKTLHHTQSINGASLEPCFNTIHQRTDMSQIELYHLFFNFIIRK